MDAEQLLNPSKAKTYLPMKRRDRPFMIFEGVSATDPAYLRLLLAVREKAMEIPADTLENGVYSGDGVTDEAQKLGNILGYSMNPCGTPPYDAYSQYGGETVPAIAWKVLDILLDICIPRSVPTARIKINPYSSVGLPSLATDAETKRWEAMAWAERGASRLKLMAGGHLRELREKEGLVWANTVGSRSQSTKVGNDGTTKPREVFTFERQWVTASRSLPEALSAYSPVLVRCRHRVVNVCSMASFPLRYPAKAIRGQMKAAASFTFEHRGEASLAVKTAKYAAIRFFDAETHDWHIHPGFFRRMINVIGERMGWAWAGMFVMTLRQGQLVKSDSLGSAEYRVDGEPFELDSFRALYGNPSGVPYTSEVAKLAGAWYGLYALVALGAIEATKRSILELLTGGNPQWAFLNAGDNLAVCGPDDATIARIPSLVPFAVLGEADTFLGSVPIRRNGLRDFCPNINSYLVNLLQPSRSQTDKQRGDPIVGAAARQKLFATAPAYAKFNAILEPLLWDFLKIDYGALVRAGEAMAGSMDYVEAVLAYNPDAIHYKLDPDEVDQVLGDDDQDKYFVSIREDVGSRIIQQVNGADQRAWRAVVEMLTSDYEGYENVS